ncbi:hypothetical protein [Henriciella sp.]|uniref:hypothetical protein n=1 Tax=Henriciella sp. TaxID=1968823 RepID=UPI00262271E5|nr:hypothetical protein [Henriciella sp.]
MSDIGMILQRIGAKLVTDVAPKLEGDYSAGHASMSGMMSVMAGEMWDKQADLLIHEVTRLEALLSTGGVKVENAQPESFRISDLTAKRNELAALLVDLQAELEERDDEEARALNEQVWGHLLATSAARMPSPPVFAGADEEDA